MDALAELPPLIDELAAALAREPLCIWPQGRRWMVIADLHGDLPVLEYVLTHWQQALPDHDLCFLGDFVDRGPDSLEVLLRVLQTKQHYGQRVVLLRGNHETVEMARRYGTGALLRERNGTHLWPALGRIFGALPLAAVLNRSVLAVHGGLPANAPSLDALTAHPHDDPAIRNGDPDHPVLTQFFWNDPDLSGGTTFSPNEARGGGVLFFPQAALQAYLDDHDLAAMVRGHQPFRQGYRSLFDGRLVSLHTSGRFPRPLPPHVALLREGTLTPLRLPDSLSDSSDGFDVDDG